MIELASWCDFYYYTAQVNNSGFMLPIQIESIFSNEVITSVSAMFKDYSNLQY